VGVTTFVMSFFGGFYLYLLLGLVVGAFSAELLIEPDDVLVPATVMQTTKQLISNKLLLFRHVNIFLNN
jgi:hypothetical protein